MANWPKLSSRNTNGSSLVINMTRSEKEDSVQTNGFGRLGWKGYVGHIHVITNLELTVD